MKVEGVRDDGALLITDGPVAAIVSEDGVWITPRSSALARGGWNADSRSLPDSLPAGLEKRLAAKRAEFEKLNAEPTRPETPKPTKR